MKRYIDSWIVRNFKPLLVYYGFVGFMVPFLIGNDLYAAQAGLVVACVMNIFTINHQRIEAHLRYLTTVFIVGVLIGVLL